MLGQPCQERGDALPARKTAAKSARSHVTLRGGGSPARTPMRRIATGAELWFEKRESQKPQIAALAERSARSVFAGDDAVACARRRPRRRSDVRPGAGGAAD